MQHKNKEGTYRKFNVKRLGVATLLTFILSFSTVFAQENFNASGSNVFSSQGSVSYSVGQVFYQTHTGTNGSLAEGVQLPYEISVVTSIEEAEGIMLSITAYPNPTNDYLTLRIDEFDISNLLYELYDMNGKILQIETIVSIQTIIVMSNFVPANYFLKVIQGNKEVKTFKIIKN